MRNLFLIFLLVFVILSETAETFSQTRLFQKKSCHPTAAEIISLIKSTYEIPISPEEILIAGEIRIGWWKYPLKVESVSLNRILAELNANKEFAVYVDSLFFIIQQPFGEHPKIKLEIKSGFNKDFFQKNIILEKGDIFFASRGCDADGKLLPISNSRFMRFPPNGTDEPMIIPKKKVAAE